MHNNKDEIILKKSEDSENDEYEDDKAKKTHILTYFLISHSRVYNTGTDTSQGKGQIVSNINACIAVQSTIKSTLGPYGGDLLMVDENGRQTITNDGATVMKVRQGQNKQLFLFIRLFFRSIQNLLTRIHFILYTYSYSTSYIPPRESWSTSRDHKTPR